MKNNEMVLKQSDLAAIGINTQLTTNDLVEVVAHEIYDKYVDSVMAVKNRVKELTEDYENMYLTEMETVKGALLKSKHLLQSDKPHLSWENKSTYDQYDSRTISEIKITEESLNKGMTVKYSDRNIYIVLPKKDKINIRIRLYVSKETNKENIKVGDIEGAISSSTEKEFFKTLTVDSKPLKEFYKAVAAHNERVKEVIDFLPKNGILSVERFTREARVKMNKKIISSQSPDFKNKMAQLFNIKL